MHLKPYGPLLALAVTGMMSLILPALLVDVVLEKTDEPILPEVL